MILEKTARETLTAVEMDVGDELVFRLFDGSVRRILLEKASARVHETTLPDLRKAQMGARTVCRCHCRLRIDGCATEMVRWIGNDRSFYEPWELFGLRIWFDATLPLFDFLQETHGACKPRKAARFAVQDASRRICPVLLHPWCPLPKDGLKISDCYDGSDCWMGPYFGAEAHGGLDINHPAGTPIWAPVEIHDHEFFDHIDRGANNNRWRGHHDWPDGSRWILQTHHVIRLLTEEHKPIPAGMQYALGAGVLTGSHEHSHFVFKVREPGAADGEEILLDPWILFWQMYQDRRTTAAK
jgi:hypothetical protein